MRQWGRNDDAPHAARAEQATYGVYDEWNPMHAHECLGAAIAETFASPSSGDERDGGRA